MPQPIAASIMCRLVNVSDWPGWSFGRDVGVGPSVAAAGISVVVGERISVGAGVLFGGCAVRV